MPTLRFIDLTVAACRIQYTFWSLCHFFFSRENGQSTRILEVRHFRMIRNGRRRLLGAQSINTERALSTQNNTAPHRTASTAQHSTAQHSTSYHITAQHSTAPHRTALHRAAPHRTAPHRTARTAPHSTVLIAPHRTAQHRTAPHNTIKFQHNKIKTRWFSTDYWESFSTRQDKKVQDCPSRTKQPIWRNLRYLQSRLRWRTKKDEPFE